MIKWVYVFFLFSKIDKNNFYFYLKIIIYFTLFLKIIFREQPSNCVKIFLKQVFILKNRKLILNHTTKHTLRTRLIMFF